MINVDFLRSGDKWSASEIIDLKFNFATSTPLAWFLVPEFDEKFVLSDLGSAFIDDQEDVVRFLLLSPSEVQTYSGSNSIDASLKNSVDYRVSFADVITAGFSEDAGGQMQFVNHEGESTESASLAGSAGGIGVSGDIVINEIDPEYDELSPGQEGYWTLLHEMGHAVGGLKDFDDPFDPVFYNNQKYTVMSYHPVNGVFASGLQLLDIKALQDTYGTVNTSTRSGNTTYSLGQGLGFDGSLATDPFLYTIWDGGGIDTIDVSGFSTLNHGAEIDLREGHFSSIGAKTTSGDPWNVDSGASVGDPDPGNVAIAYGTKIENAFGTDKDDRFIGNDENNKIWGGDGADTFESSKGIDTLRGEGGTDLLTYKNETDYVVVSYSAADRGRVYKAGDKRDNFYTMEHIEGSTLDDMFSLKGSATPAKSFGLDGDDYFYVSEVQNQSVYIDGGSGTDQVFLDGLDISDFTVSVGATTVYTNIANPSTTLEFKDVEDIRFGGTDAAYAGSWMGQNGGLILGKSLYANIADYHVKSNMADRGDYSSSISRESLYAEGLFESSLSTASIYWDYEKRDPEGNPTGSGFDAHIGGAASFSDRITITSPTPGGTGYTEFSFSFDIQSSSNVDYTTHYFDVVNVAETGAAGNLQVQIFGGWYDVSHLKTFSNAMASPANSQLNASRLVENYRFVGDDITFDFFVGSSIGSGLPPQGSGEIYAGYGKIEADIILASGSTIQSESGVFNSQTRNDGVQLWEGTDNDETFVGSGFDENLYGYVGNDTISGEAGVDRLYGGDGLDTLNGGDDKDYLYGQNDNDILYGEGGNDYMYGHAGSDELVGGTGQDSIWGGADADTFLYQLGDLDGSRDYIRDFDATEGDVIDISDVIDFSSVAGDVITDFVFFTNGSTYTRINVDQDGTGSTHGLTAVAQVLNNPSLDIATMITNGSLVVE